MSIDSNETSLTLYIVKMDGEADVDDLNQLTHTLMKSLEDIDVESVTLLQDPHYVPGAKGDLFTIGGLLVSALPVVLPNVLEFLQKWALRNRDYVIRAKVQRGNRSAEIECSANVSPNDLKNYVEIIKQLIDG